MEQPEMLVVLGVLVLIVIAVLAFVYARSRRSSDVKERFGPEYERTVERTGDRKEAEAELRAREERRDELDIRSLDPERRERYQSAWQDTEKRFVDEPEAAIREADQLVTEVMRERGYPMEDLEQRAADISVDHPTVVEHYRAAADIAVLTERGEASTEDLRQAMTHYRALFDDLLETRSADTDREAR